MKINNIIATLAIIAIVISLANFLVTLTKTSDMKQLTGYATGEVNLTVQQMASINFSITSIEWGHGKVNQAEDNATLYTNGGAAPTIERGNWSSSATGLVLENVGNINVSITLQGTASASDLFASESGTHQMYQWNVSNKEINSCSEAAGVLNEFWDANKSDAATVCDQFDFGSGNNEIYIDVLMTIPSDSRNQSITLSDTITATGTAS